MSAQFFLQQRASAIGVAAIGALADSFGIVAPMLAASALSLIVWIAIFRRRGVLEAAFVPSSLSG
jgi:hypothetical protein